MNNVKVKCNSSISNMAEVSIGGQIIPVYQIDIKIKVGEPVKVTLEVPAEAVDIEALQKNTELIVRKFEDL